MTEAILSAPARPPVETRSAGNSLRIRMRTYAVAGFLVVGAWLYYTINAVYGLYDATLQIAGYTDLRERTTEAAKGLSEAWESLDRYLRTGDGYDLSQHSIGRTSLKTSLGAIRRHPLTEGTLGKLRTAESAADVYTAGADKAIALRADRQPGEYSAVRDNEAAPAAAVLRDSLAELQLTFARGQQFAEQRLATERDAATAALGILAGLIVIGISWLLADVNRRILSPCAAASRALEDLAAGRPSARLSEASRDEIGALGLHFNRAAGLYEDRGKQLEARDIDASVNAVLAAAATINDLSGFGSRLLEKILEATGASSAILYLPNGKGGFAPAASIGGSAGNLSTGEDEAARAAREGKPILVSVDPATPTVDLFDGRTLPRESLHLPLMYFGEPVGVLALGSMRPFTDRARNTLTAIAPSLAVALANASANQRLADQSRRLSEQNELLEEQRSRISRTAQELQRASALKDRFLAAVSHELRTPMTVILGFTGTLLRGTQGELTPQQRESLDRVQRNARLLLGLINDVLDISRIESGKAEIHREVVSIATLLGQVESDFTDAAARKNLTLTTGASSGLETIISDPGKLNQILANLVGNALKFTESGFVDVRAEPRGPRQWALVVSDSGIGIPEEEQDAIFEEFRQGESTDHQGRGGTGLGLAIVRKLASLLGGTVTVQSAAGQGSTFTVTLPRELAGGEPEAPLLLPRAASSESRSALVVDDDEGTRKLVRMELEAYGLRVFEAKDGREAVELARREAPAVVVLDVLMPRMDGWTALRELKESPDTRPIPVVLHSVIENRAAGLALGAFDCLVKPVTAGRLSEVLARAGVVGLPGYVLVVDDDRNTRELLVRELTEAGFRAVAVGGGAEALTRIAAERPAAVLLDLVMPDPDGFAVLYRLKQDPALRRLPVIVMTAKQLDEVDYERINGSARRVLSKGLDLTRLVRDTLASLESERAPA